MSTRRPAAAGRSSFVWVDRPPARKPGYSLPCRTRSLKWNRRKGHVSLAYLPEMEWRAAYGPFESDRVCLGLYEMSGVDFPAHNLGEWQYVREPDRVFDRAEKLDWAETDALARCVDAFVLCHPQKALRVHVPWCENDYQIDVSTPAGRGEWKRILDQCVAVGIENSLFTPANSTLAPLQDNADAWGWENCLWLGLGQKIRKGQWHIATDPIPPSIQEMLDYAKARKVKLVAYVYPTLGWKQNPAWTAWCGGRPADTWAPTPGVRSSRTGSSTSSSPSRSGPASAATVSIIGGSPTSRRKKVSGRQANMPNGTVAAASSKSFAAAVPTS